MKATVMLFNFSDKSRVMKIRQALLPLGIRIKTVDKSEYLQCLGYLAGEKDDLPVEDIYEGEELSAELFVMAGITRIQMDQILAAMRKKGVGYIPYKAVLTETNSRWNVLTLFDEICKEHKAMHGE